MRLKDRVGIVTGSGRGIGAATAICLAEEGAKITVTDVNAETCEETAQKIREAGGEAIAVPCDITKRQEVEDMVQKTVDTFGRLDILVNNAGVIRDNLVHKMTDEDWDIVMDVHLKGTFMHPGRPNGSWCQTATGKLSISVPLRRSATGDN